MGRISAAHHGKIGLSTSAVVHAGIFALGLAIAAPEVAPHFHLHRGAIEIQGSFASPVSLDTPLAVQIAVPEEHPAEPTREPPRSVETSPEIREFQKPVEPLRLSALAAQAEELAVCDCPAPEHAMQTPKRKTEVTPPAPLAPPAPTAIPRSTTVAQVSADLASSAQAASIPANSEPAGSSYDLPPSVAPANRPPPYPSEAYQQRLEGRVLIEVRITPAGTVESLRLVESSGTASLDRSALETVRTWRFEPARRGGIAVESLMNVPVRFKIRTS